MVGTSKYVGWTLGFVKFSCSNGHHCTLCQRKTKYPDHLIPFLGSFYLDFPKDSDAFLFFRKSLKERKKAHNRISRDRKGKVREKEKIKNKTLSSFFSAWMPEAMRHSKNLHSLSLSLGKASPLESTKQKIIAVAKGNLFLGQKEDKECTSLSREQYIVSEEDLQEQSKLKSGRKLSLPKGIRGSLTIFPCREVLVRLSSHH